MRQGIDQAVQLLERANPRKAGGLAPAALDPRGDAQMQQAMRVFRVEE